MTNFSDIYVVRCWLQESQKVEVMIIPSFGLKVMKKTSL